MFEKGSFSILDKSIIVNGDIFSPCVVDVCGVINGDIIVDTLNVKNNGKIFGNVYAKNVIVSENGNIKGNIVSNTIKLLNKSVINGNFIYSRMEIEDGAIINGSFTKKDEEEISILFNEEMEKKGFNETIKQEKNILKNNSKIKKDKNIAEIKNK